MKNIKKLLAQNPTFNLQKDNLARLSVQENFNWGRFKKDKWLPQLQTYQRLYRIHPNEAVVEQLMDAGIHSAHQIASMPQGNLVEQLNSNKNNSIDAEVSNNIWQKSRAITYRVNQMAMALRPMPNDTAVMQKSVAVTEATGRSTADDFETDIPAYSELFGPQYYCQCDDCKSIWGPAAYFTDLMTTIEEYISLEGEEAAAQETPFIFMEDDQLKDVKEDVVSNAAILTESININGDNTTAYHFDGTACFELNKMDAVFLPDGFSFECTFNLQEIPDADSGHLYAALFDCRDYTGSDHGITVYFKQIDAGIQLQIWLEGNTHINYSGHYIDLDTWYTFRVVINQGTVEFRLTPQDNSSLVYTQKYTNHAYSPSAIGRLRVGAGASNQVDANYHWEGYIKNPVFNLIEPPKLSLQARRPDLWTMELNCENTNTEVPYLQVANEVMSAKLQAAVYASSPDELEQYIANHPYPFNLPLNLPEEEISGYLDHFGFSQSQILDYLQAEEADIARTVFGISTNQLALLTGVNASTRAVITVDNDHLSTVYGVYDSEKGTDIEAT
ncbi:MAG: Tc toxin subunit A, partial [Bacteroidota bacterium]